MLSFRHLIPALLVTISFYACQPQETNKIFLCGTTPEYRAFYYSNGTQKILSPESEVSAALAIDIKDSIIYCAGTKASSNENCLAATLWKDGTAIELTDGKNNAFIYDFCIKDGNIWCAGTEEDGKRYQNSDNEYVRHIRAKVWCVQNDGVVKTIVLTNGTKDAKPKGIYIDDNDLVHVVGYDNKRPGCNELPGLGIGRCDTGYDSRYWIIDGQECTLLRTEFLSKTSGMGTAIWGEGAEIMIGGHIDYDLDSSGGWDALYWKDGWSRNMESDFETVIEDGCMCGNDWYMCGHSRNSRALYYKNGELKFLTDTKQELESKTFAIALANSDIYIAGYMQAENGLRMNGYWKNDKFIKIDELFGTPADICVIPSHIEASAPKSTPAKSNAELIYINGRGHRLEILPDKSGYYLFTERINEDNKYAPVKISDIVFTGKYEHLNLQILKNSEKYVILHSDNGKYLWNSAEECFMLDGNSFEKLEKDNDGGLCIPTKEGRYHISDTEGLPGKVDKYYRSGEYHDMFIYKFKGKWGVYCNLTKTNGYGSRTLKRKYMEILPAVYDKIRYVTGDGATHFVCQKNGAWEIRDVYGRKRKMECSYGRHWSLNTTSFFSSKDMSSTYISQVNSMSPNAQDKYSPFFKTRYSSTGEKDAFIVNLEDHKNDWENIFDACFNNDKSRNDPPGWEWTEKELLKWDGYGY